MPLAFGALREGDIRLCTEGKVTRISLSSNLYWSVSESILVSVQTYIGQHTNLYWSMIGSVLVTRRTSIGQRVKQYCLLLVTSTGSIADQYWSQSPSSAASHNYLYIRAIPRSDLGTSLASKEI